MNAGREQAIPEISEHRDPGIIIQPSPFSIPHVLEFLNRLEIHAMATATMTATKKKVKFRPIEDRVLIEPIEAEDRTTGGIILPDTAKEKPVRGTVIARGPGKLLDNGKRGEMSVSVGDEVFYGKYSGTEIEIGSDKFIVLRETDILAIVEN